MKAGAGNCDCGHVCICGCDRACITKSTIETREQEQSQEWEQEQAIATATVFAFATATGPASPRGLHYVDAAVAILAL